MILKLKLLMHLFFAGFAVQVYGIVVPFSEKKLFDHTNSDKEGANRRFCSRFRGMCRMCTFEHDGKTFKVESQRPDFHYNKPIYMWAVAQPVGKYTRYVYILKGDPCNQVSPQAYRMPGNFELIARKELTPLGSCLVFGGLAAVAGVLYCCKDRITGWVTK